MAITSLASSLAFYPKAHQVIVRHRLWPYMILPGLMSFVFFIGLVGIGNLYFSDIATRIYQDYFPEFLKWDLLLIATKLLFWTILFLTGYILYQPVVLTLFSPVLGYLSEVTEKRVHGNASGPFQLRQFLKDTLRGVALSLRNLIRMIVFILLAWLMIFIPIAGAGVSAALIFLIQAYFNGFALTDYTLERKQYSVKERIRFAKEHRARVTGIGIGFMLVLFVPVLGWFIAPAYGTVAATLSTLAVINKKAGTPPSIQGELPARDQIRPTE